jgi:trans-aconitate methyltransferase
MLEQQMSPGHALEKNYANGQTAEEWQQKDSQRGKLGDVKVITPDAYEALSAEEKAKIDQHPTYFVTDMTRKQAMAAFVNGELTKDKAVKPQEGEKAVPVTEPHN